MLKKLREIFKHHAEEVSKKLGDRVIEEKDLEGILWDLEIALLESNVSLEVIEILTRKLKESLVGKKMSGKKIKEMVRDLLREELDRNIKQGRLEDLVRDTKPPYVFIFIGFNGVGKTTTIAKIGKYLLDKGKSVVFAAGDTYRAAAIEQLEEHAKNLGVKCIKSKYKSDSAAVIYDARQYAEAHNISYVLADTSGRVHTNKNLIEEIKKVVRVNNPTGVFLVIDSTTGSDVMQQAKMFDEVNFNGYILTKVDVDDKGGSIVNISYAVKKPIFFISYGQEYDKIKEFNKKEVIDLLTGW